MTAAADPPIPPGYYRVPQGKRILPGDHAWTWTSADCLSLGWVLLEEPTGIVDKGHVPVIRKGTPKPATTPTLTAHVAVTKEDIAEHVESEIAVYESLPGLWTVAMHRMAITHEDSEDDAKHTAEKLNYTLHNSIVKFLEARSEKKS